MENHLCGIRKSNNCIEELKKRLASAEILGYFDKNAQTKVIFIADASPVGLGAVLVQQQGEEL